MAKQARAARPTQAELVFQAVKKGAQSPTEISKKTKIPPRNVNTVLYTLRQSGSIRGFAGSMKAKKAPQSKRGGRQAKRAPRRTK